MKSLNESLCDSLLLETRPDEVIMERVADLAEEIKSNKDLIKAGYMVTSPRFQRGRQKPKFCGRDGWLLDLDLWKKDGSDITYNDIDIIINILGLKDIKTDIKTETLFLNRNFNKKCISGYIDDGIICDICLLELDNTIVIDLAVITLRIPTE